MRTVAAHLQDEDKMTLTVLHPLLSQQPSKILPRFHRTTVCYGRTLLRRKSYMVYVNYYVPDAKKNSAQSGNELSYA